MISIRRHWARHGHDYWRFSARRKRKADHSMEGTSYLIDYGDLLARFCLSFVFLWSGVSKAFHPTAGRAEIAALGLPDANLFLPLTVACQIGGGLMGVPGFLARLGAVAVLALSLSSTPLAPRNRGVIRLER